jgi:hypothetical protein
MGLDHPPERLRGARGDGATVVPLRRPAVARRDEPASVEALLGSTVVAWTIELDSVGRVGSQAQVWGAVVRVGARQLVLEDPASGEQTVVRSDLDGFTAAPPGEYRIRHREGVVADPDWVASWVRTAPPSRRRSPPGGKIRPPALLGRGGGLAQRPGLDCMTPPSAKTVVAVT